MGLFSLLLQVGGESFFYIYFFIYQSRQDGNHDVCLLLFYVIATVFQLYLGSVLMYEMRRKPEPTLLP